MARVYVRLYHDVSDMVNALSDAEAGRLLKAVLEFSRTGEVIELPGQEKLVFMSMRSQIERDIAVYEKKVEVNQQNGRLGGRPRTRQENPPITQNNPNGFSGFLQKPTETEKKARQEQDYKTTTPLPPSGGSSDSYIADNIVGMTVGNWDELRSYLDDGLSMDVVRYAVDEAAAYGKRTWGYVRKVLNRCLVQGITTVEQAKSLAPGLPTDTQDERKRREDERTLAKLRGELPK